MVNSMLVTLLIPRIIAKCQFHPAMTEPPESNSYWRLEDVINICNVVEGEWIHFVTQAGHLSPSARIGLMY